MQNTTADYKLEINKPSRQFECKITIGDNIYTNEDLVNLTLEYTQPQEGFAIGNTISKSLDLTLLNKGDIIYSTSQIKVEIGLKIGSKIEYILMGTFNIDDIEKTDYTTKFTAYDNMIKFETPYFSSLGDKPTLKQVVNELSSKTGVEFTGSLPAYTVNKLDGFSCREVLSYVASICGGNAIITRDGKFTIKTLSEVGKAIDGNNYFDYKREEVKYKVGQISCQVDENNILSKGSIGTDSMELAFENPWITETILTEIYNKLNGLSYLGYSMKWQGDLSLDPYDIITVTDIKNVVRKIPILSQKITYTGGLTSEIGAKGETKNKNSFSSSGSTTNKVNRAVIEQAIIKEALIEKANIKDVEAVSIRTQTLEAKTAKIEELISDVAHIKDLNAINANIEKLIAADATINNALIGKADITELNAVKGTINVLESDTANIKNLLAGNISGESGQLIHLTASNVVIADAVIKDLIASNISVEDLKASTISTNKFSIASTDGGLSIVGPTMQFKDKNNKVRIQMGQDATGNFNFILRGEDGTTTLIDHTGIKEKAIADDLIKSNMVATDAIGEKQINYSSLITGLNKDTNTSLIKASKVAIDLAGQTLDVAFNSLKSNVDNMEIGGTNLATDTNKGVTGWGWVLQTGGRTISEATENDIRCCKMVRDSVDATGWSYIYYARIGRSKYLPSRKYTVSFEVKASVDTSFWCQIQEGNSSNKITNSVKTDVVTANIWTKVYVTLTTINSFPSSTAQLLYLNGMDSGTGITYIFRNLKIEEGTKASNWSPAPEDIDSSIESVKQITESNSTTINVMQGQIATAINNTQIVKDGQTILLKDDYNRTVAIVDSINSTIGTHTTKIDELTGSITSVDTKVNSVQRDLEGTKSTVSSHSTSITDLSSKVSTQGSSISQLQNQIKLKVESTEVNTIVNGAISKTAKSLDVMYYLSTSATSLAGGSWSTTAPTWTNGKYMWSKTVTTFVDGSKKESSPTCIAGATGATGANGAAGKGIKSIVEQYYLSTSNTTQTGGAWVTSPPAWANGKYMWTRSVITYTDNSTTTTNPVCVSGSKGDTGDTGASGNSFLTFTTNYQYNQTNIDAYSKSGYTGTWNVNEATNGCKVGDTVNIRVYNTSKACNSFIIAKVNSISTTAINTTSLGIAENGATGAKGDKGDTGVGISSVDVEYYLSTSATSLAGGSWSTTAPTWVNGKYMWSRTKTVTTAGATTYSNPVCITGAKGSTGATGTKGDKGDTGNTGATGQGISSIAEEYYLSTSKTSQTGGSWATTPPTWSTGKYMWTRSKIVYKNPTSTAYTTPVCDTSWEAVNEVEIGGRNYISQGKGDKKEGFFKYFNKVENGYGEHTLTSKKSYSSVSIASGFLLGCRDYEVGKQVTISYDFMYTVWNFPSGTNRTELWMGQRYTQASSSSSNGAWRVVTLHSLPVVGENGCELNKWIHIEKTMTIPSQADVTIGTASAIQFYNSNADVSASITFRIKNVKIEYGNKATDWSPAPEDVDNSIANVQTQVTTTSNKVATIETNLSSITQRVSSTESTVSTHTTQLGTVDSRINTAKNSAISTASSDATTKANNAQKNAINSAKTYTDGQITTVNKTITNKVAEIKATTDSITSKVEIIESTTTTINGNVTSLQSKVNTVESKITGTAIVNTISSTITGGTGSISTTQFVMDKNGLTIKNGALTIKNKAGTTVLNSDTSGNLIITGEMRSQYGQQWVGLNAGGLTFQDWNRNEQMLRVGLSYFNSNRDMNGVNFALAKYGDFIRFSHIEKTDLTNGWSSSDAQYNFFDCWSSDQTVGGVSYKKGINIYSPMFVNSGIQLFSGTNYPSEILGAASWDNGSGTIWNMMGLYGDNGTILGYKSGSSLMARFLVSEDTHPGTGDNIKSWGNYNFNGYTFHNASIAANYLTVSGSKNCLQKTKNYGSRLINAYETAEYYFGDLGFGEINEDGECFVSLDDIFLECVNTDAQYHVFTQAYEGAIKSIERHKTYFIVKGEANTSFSWEIKAKRLGYENNRLDVQELETSQPESGLELFPDSDFKADTSEDILLTTLTFNLEDILLTMEE